MFSIDHSSSNPSKVREEHHNMGTHPDTLCRQGHLAHQSADSGVWPTEVQ